VRARVRARARRYLRAELVDVVRAGAVRTAPPCPAFGRCGGCQWQHVDLAAQRAAKTQVVVEQLARVGGIPDAPVRPILAADGLAYRTRITLVAEARRLGYHRRGSHVLEEVDACPIATPALAAHLDAAREWMARLPAVVERMTIAEAPGGVAFVAMLGRAPASGDVATTDAFLHAHASVRGVVLRGGGRRTTLGDVTVHAPVEDDLVLEAPADAFTQINPAANRLVVASALDLGAFSTGARVLDLYCGIGNFALPLARRGVAVRGVERDAVAVAAARANAARLGVAARFDVADVARALGDADGALDGVVLDPPRGGAAAALAPLAALRPRRIVYVSCDPATLARDAARLVAGGWRLVVAQPVDVFPQTFHVETVALFELT